MVAGVGGILDASSLTCLEPGAWCLDWEDSIAWGWESWGPSASPPLCGLHMVCPAWQRQGSWTFMMAQGSECACSERERASQWKLYPFYDLATDVTQHHFRLFLFIRIESLSMAYIQEEKN